MHFLRQIERIQELDRLVKKRSTGSPNKLANKLGISRSHLYNLIGYLNDIGMKIKYSRSLGSFYYVNDQEELEIDFSIKIVNNENQYKIYGGKATNLTLTSIPFNYIDG
jgi:biotin operon repressor